VTLTVEYKDGTIFLLDGEKTDLMNLKDLSESTFVPKYFALRSGVNSEADWKVLKEMPVGWKGDETEITEEQLSLTTPNDENYYALKSVKLQKLDYANGMFYKTF